MLKLIIILWLLLSGCVQHKISYNKKLLNINLALGYEYIRIGDLGLAKKYFLQARKIKPTDPDANTGLAYFYAAIQRQTQAKYFFQKSMQYAINKGRYWYNYGNYLCMHGNHKEGKKYLLMAAKDVNYTGNARAFHDARLCYKITAK